MIELSDVGFAYRGGVVALRGVEVRFASGCVALLGHNGAGKTTLLRHLNGLLRPSRGRVLVRGTDTRTARPAALARSVGLAFQNPSAQLFRNTVLEEIRAGAERAPDGAAPVEARVDWAARVMGLRDLLARNPYDVALGTRKRVAIASVIAMGTPVVVLDEPTGSQDARGVTLLDGLVGELLAGGKLVIVATHDVEFAQRHAQRVVLLAGGEVVCDGATADVFADEDALGRARIEAPAVARLARALGAPPTTDDGALVAWLRERRGAGGSRAST